MALTCAASGFGLFMAGKFDLLPPAVRYESATIWIMNCLCMGVTIALLRLPNLLIRTALVRAESELSERKSAQEMLLENQRLLQTMIENAPAAVAMFDTEMRYLAYSRRWLTDYHLVHKDLKGFTHYEVFPEIGEDWKEIHRRCLAGARSTRDRVSFPRADGTEDFIRWNIQPWFKGNGETGGITMYTEVITDRVRAEEERGLLQEQLLEAQKFEALGTLAGGIAHDFNNLLAMIGTNAELGLAEVAKPEAVSNCLGEIVGATARAKDIVRQILVFSRKQDTSFETILLTPIVEEALKFLHATVPANVEIRKVLESGVPPVRANASQIYQVLMNLGANAAHALTAGGVITVGLKSVTVTNAKAARSRGLHAGEYVRITIQDTGIGMDKETLNRVFEPFFTTKGLQGSGLGMSVVHGLIKSHGGAITVESEPGKGTRVQVYFPVTLGRSADAHLSKETAVPGQGQNILYIDDEESLGRAMKRVLALLGYRCTFYADPRAALDAFRADPGQFDAVISDMAMSNLSGLDVAREISAIRPDLPIALTSGKIEQDTDSISHFEGVMAWLSKPATIDEIGTVLTIMLQDSADGRDD